MKVTLTADDGHEYDVTEHFQVMYDQLVGGMDWGSGFLDGNDALIVMQAGAAAGFKIDLYGQLGDTSALLKAFPHEGAKDYYALSRKRNKWVEDQLGDPPTWDTIAAYRQRLAEMEDSE